MGLNLGLLGHKLPLMDAVDVLEDVIAHVLEGLLGLNLFLQLLPGVHFHIRFLFINCLHGLVR